jgi:hypothetical protein
VDTFRRKDARVRDAGPARKPDAAENKANPAWLCLCLRLVRELDERSPAFASELCDRVFPARRAPQLRDAPAMLGLRSPQCLVTLDGSEPTR